MNILLTNDDGYRSKGILALKEALAVCGHTVWMIAPTDNMSACSHSITIARPLRVRPLNDTRSFSCSGTPADCVILGLRGVVDGGCDCVVSGINLGPNLGDDITFSGTVAAARQGVLMGLPAVAVSLFDEQRRTPYFLNAAAAQVSARLPELLALSDEHHLVNINVPNSEQQMRYVSAHPATRLYDDLFSSYSPPNSRDRFYFMASVPRDAPPQQNSDLETVRNGDIAVSVINIHPAARDVSDYGDMLQRANGKRGEGQ